MRIRVLALALALVGTLGASSSASAATLDFSGFGFNQDLGLQAVLPEATITTSAGTIRRLFNLNGYCVVGPLGCDGVSTITFVAPVESLRFEIFGTAPGESTAVRVFGAAGLVVALNVVIDGVVDLSGYGVVTAIELSSLPPASFAGGTAFRDFSFDFAPVAEPHALARGCPNARRRATPRSRDGRASRARRCERTRPPRARGSGPRARACARPAGRPAARRACTRG